MDNGLKCSTNRNEKWIVDRFEECNAVLENAATLDTMTLLKADLPQKTQPGDTLVMRDGAWHFDHAETEARARRIQERFNRIRARNR